MKTYFILFWEQKSTKRGFISINKIKQLRLMFLLFRQFIVIATRKQEPGRSISVAPVTLLVAKHRYLRRHRLVYRLRQVA
jgi:hypothetical protein